MREKILSLLSTLEKGKFEESSAGEQEDFIRNLVLQVSESVLKDLCKKDSTKEGSPKLILGRNGEFEGDNYVASMVLENGNENEKPQEMEVNKKANSANQAMGTFGEKPQEMEVNKKANRANQAIGTFGEKGQLNPWLIHAVERENNVANVVLENGQMVFGENGQIRPWIFHAFEAFISSMFHVPNEGRRSSVIARADISSQEEEKLPCQQECSQVLKCAQVDARKQNYPECAQVDARKQNYPEISTSMEEDIRKEEFLKLLRLATRKGEVVLMDNDFLEQCSNFLMLGPPNGDKSEMVLKKKGKEMIVAENMEDDDEACLAERRVGFLGCNGQASEKKEEKGPTVNSPPVNRIGAVNDASCLPMHKGDRFAQKGGTKDLAKGQNIAFLGDIQNSYADIVKSNKFPTLCPPPSHVGNLDILKCPSPPNAPCTENTLHVPLPCTFKNSHVPLTSKQDSLPSSEIENRNPTLAFNKTVSSREEMPMFKIDSNILARRLNLCQFSVIGKVTLAKGNEPWTLKKLREKLEDTWKLHSAWRLIGLGKGYFQILLLSKEEWDKVWARGPIQLGPGTMRLQRWSMDFDPLKEKTTNAQVWFRISQLPWGLWDPNVISGIACKVGVPLRIDNATLNGDFGHYARVLVDVDVSYPPISVVRVECGNHTIEVKITPESLPSFCSNCNIIGHQSNECRNLIPKGERPNLHKGKRGGEPGLQIAETLNASVSKTGQELGTMNGPIPNDPAFKKAKKDDDCFDSILGSSFVKYPEDNRFIDAMVTKEVFDVTGKERHTNHAMAMQVSRKGESSKGKSVVESPNRFSALSDIVEAEVVESSLPYLPVRDQGGPQASNEEEVRIPKLPKRWSDIMDEEDDKEKFFSIDEANATIMRARADFDGSFQDISDFRARLKDVWVDRDDSRFERDMPAVFDPPKDVDPAPKPFFAHIPKKDKKIKIGVRQPKG